MQINLGSWDRGLRIGIGSLLILLAVFDLVGPWGYVGLLPLVTGAFRFCPAYRIFGISTCAMDRR